MCLVMGTDPQKMLFCTFCVLYNHCFNLSLILCLQRCLVHILKENTLRYSKVRPLYPQCQLDLCRHEVRYGCVREDECLFAHSLVELKVWMMQHEMGKQQEALVK